ncbi:hypothetical protein A2U01_0109144, partial [Trifolium medium]|nr:hypothetical protein [Trifolium medium]
ADTDHVVEIHPSVPFGDLLHPLISGDAREVNAPLLSNALSPDDLIVCFFGVVEEVDVVL